METRCADPTLQLDVDVMILDFLVYSALDKTLKTAPSDDADRALRMVDDFLIIFNENHPQPPDNPNLEFRLRLLQFATLFRRRHEHSSSGASQTQLRQLRADHTERSLLWQCRAKGFKQISKLGYDESHEFALPRSDTTLLDLLPLFMSISAELGEPPSARLMHLAAEFMLQSVLEVARLNAKRMTEDQFVYLSNEAFAWGCPQAFKPDDVFNMTEIMFWDFERGAELQEWSELRNEYHEELTSPDGVAFDHHHLQTIKDNYPSRDFDTVVTKYLTTISATVEQPILAQLEGKQITGLSELETKRLKIRCGLNT